MGAFIITFTEGDPMLREDIFELIEYVDKERAIVNMYTPGTEMTPKAAQKAERSRIIQSTDKHLTLLTLKNMMRSAGLMVLLKKLLLR
jgi:uncharacterized radical SAM superfamily Fe-S cluster-containing enzyme